MHKRFRERIEALEELRKQQTQRSFIIAFRFVRPDGTPSDATIAKARNDFICRRSTDETLADFEERATQECLARFPHGMPTVPTPSKEENKCRKRHLELLTPGSPDHSIRHLIMLSRRLRLIGLWFEKHPKEDAYIRELCPGEFGLAELPEVPPGFPFRSLTPGPMGRLRRCSHPGHLFGHAIEAEAKIDAKRGCAKARSKVKGKRESEVNLT
jgi:hypothetical protein